MTQRKKTGSTRERGRAEPSAAKPAPPVDAALALGSIVHDLKNILSAVRGFATVIGEDLRPQDPARDDVEQILTAVDRGVHVAERLLALRDQVPTPPSGVPIEVTLERSVGWTMQQPKRSATILVVEDDDLVRTMAVRVLRRNGYATIEAGSAPEAEDRAKANGARIDLLLVDVGLPVTNGPVLVKRLKQRWPTLRVLFMSAFGRLALAELGISHGSGFLEKPFSPLTLVERIETILAPGSS